MRLKIIALLIIFLNLAIPSRAEAQEDYLIAIRLSEFRLILVTMGGTTFDFDIATPLITPKVLPVEATVIGVAMNPPWYPTNRTREAYLLRRNIYLPQVLKPGDPRNAMGRGIIRLKYFISGLIDENVVIHGTNDEKSIGKQVSRGCIRMHNDDIELLINIIRDRNTRVIFEK